MDRLHNQTKKLIFLSLLIFFSSQAFGERRREVNILAWWGYLANQEMIKKIENKCSATISVDEYYENTEFLRRWRDKKSSYDLIIYSNIVFENIRKDLTGIGQNLNQVVNDYHPRIREKFKDLNFPANTGLFTLSFSGFLWNEKNLKISQDDPISEIFKKSKGKKILLLDDHVEIFQLFQAAGIKKDELEKVLPELAKESKVYILNDNEAILKESDFGFAYTWSGIAYARILKLGNNLKFIVHPKLSHVTFDLITSLSQSSEATCVAKELAGKEFLESIKNEKNYISPFGGEASSHSKEFQRDYPNLLSEVGRLPWLKAPVKSDFILDGHQWKKIKLKAQKK